MLKFNHRIEVIFKKVFIINCVLQLLIFFFLFLFYNINLKDVKNQIKTEVNKSMTKFREIFQQYYQQKFLIIIDDLILLKSTFEKYSSTENQMKIEKYVNETFIKSGDYKKCLINLSAIKNENLYKQPWYSNSNFKPESYKDYSEKVMIGSWFENKNKTNIEDLTLTQKKNLAVLCKMNKLIKKIFEKNIQWSFKYPIQVEFAHFSFSDSLFYKFPAMYSDTYVKQKAEYSGDCENFNINNHFYDPKCRQFYTETVKSNHEITITLPYIQASTKKYGTEVCIRSRKNFESNIINNTNNNEFPLIICFNINYFDVDSFRSQLQGLLANKKLYIVYVDKNIEDIINQSEINTLSSNTNINIDNNLSNSRSLVSSTNLSLNISNCSNPSGYKDIHINTIYSSEIASENFVSFTKILNILPDNSNNDFYDILTFNMTLKNLVNDTPIQKDSILFSDPDKFFSSKDTASKTYNNLFTDFMSNYVQNIKCPFISKTTQMYSKEKFNALTPDSYIVNVNNTIDFIDPQMKKNALLVNIDFFVFPAFTKFDLKNETIVIVDETKFFIVIAGKFSNDELFSKFQLGLLYRFVNYFFFLILFNVLLWLSLTGFIFYVFNIYFYPLKRISSEYQNLFYPEKYILDERENDKKYKKLTRSKQDLNLHKILLKFFNIEIFSDIRKAKNSLYLLSEIKQLDKHLKTKAIDNIFLKSFNDLITLIREQFDFSENILDLNVNNDLIKNLVFLQFTKCLKNMNLEYDKYKKNSVVNNAYDDAIFFCNKVLSKGRDTNSNSNKDKKRNENNFFEAPIKQGFQDIYIEIINLIKKDFKETSFEGKIVKDILGDSAVLNIKELKVDRKNLPDAFKNVKEFLSNYKDVLFAGLIAELQYEYCIFKADNTKWISYQENIYPISFTKRISTEEKIQNYFLKLEDLNENFANLKDVDLNDSIDSKKCMIFNKETLDNDLDEGEIRNLTNELRRYISNYHESKCELDYLKHINSLVLFSGILIQINNYTEALRQISKVLQKMEELINASINKNSHDNFSMFILNSLVSEKILYLLSLIAEKSELKRTKIIIYTNLLDLSPIYNVKLRLFILGDLYNFCLDTYKRFIKRRTLIEVANIRDNNLLYHMILARHKIRSLYFSSKSNIIKNVVLLFDLNFPIIKDKHFLIYFKKFFRRREHRNYFYLSFFDEYLFLFKNFQKHELEKGILKETIELEVKDRNLKNRNSYADIKILPDHSKNYINLAKKFTRNNKGEFDDEEINDNKNRLREEENEIEEDDSEEENFTNQNNNDIINDNDSLNFIKENEENSFEDNEENSNENSNEDYDSDEFVAKNRNKRRKAITLDYLTSKLKNITHKNNLKTLYRNSQKDQFFSDVRNLNFIDKEKYLINLYDYYVSLEEQEDEDFLNESEDEFQDNKGNYIENPKREDNRYDVLRDFVNYYSKKAKTSNKLKYRLDKAIINTVLHYKFDANEERNLNYLIIFTRIEANFFDSNSLLEEFTTMLYEHEYSIIICFYYEEDLFSGEEIKERLKFYKQLISKHVINGKIFFIRNFKAIKYILDSMNFDQFDYLNLEKLNDFIEILDMD